MKVPVQARRKIPPQPKRRRIQAYSSLVYRAHKEVRPGWLKIPDFLTGRLHFPRLIVLRLVSTEASRLSKTNRRRVITLQEIMAAVSLVQQRISTRAAA